MSEPDSQAPTPVSRSPEGVRTERRASGWRSTSAPAGSSRRSSPRCSRSRWAASSSSRPATTLRDVQGDLRRHRAELVLPCRQLPRSTSRSRITHVWFWWDTNTNRTAAYNLDADADPDDDAADPHRARRRVRVPVRPLQHRRPGPVHHRRDRRASRSARRSADMAHRPARPPRDRRSRRSRARAWAAIAGFLKATVGAHEVITTIMLNWIAYWVRQAPLRPRRPAAEPTSTSRSRSRTTSSQSAQLPVVLGQPGSSRRCTSASSSRSARSSSSGSAQPDDARVRGARGRLQPGGGPLRRHQRRRATTSSRWRSPARSPGLAGGDRHPRLAVPARGARRPGVEHRLHRHRRRAARTQHRGRRRPRGAAVRRAADRAPRRAASIPTVFPPQLAGNLALMIQGARPALRRRGPVDPLHLAGPEEAAAAGGGRASTPQERSRVSAPSAGHGRSAPRRRGDVGWVGIGARRARASGWRFRPSHAAHRWWSRRRRAACGRSPGSGLSRGERRSGVGGDRRGARRHRLGATSTTRTSTATSTRSSSWAALVVLDCSSGRRRSRSPRSAACSPSASGVVNIGLEGMMLAGAFFGVLGADKFNSGSWGSSCAAVAGGGFALVHACLVDPHARRPDRRRHGDQLPRARRHRLLLHPDLRRERDARATSRGSRTSTLDAPRDSVRFWASRSAPEPDDLVVVRAADRRAHHALPDADRAAAPLRRASIRAPPTRSASRYTERATRQ